MPYNPKAAARGRGSKAKGRRNGKDRTVYADSKDHGRPTSTIRDDDEVGSQDGSENDNEEDDDDDDELVAPSCMRDSTGSRGFATTDFLPCYDDVSNSFNVKNAHEASSRGDVGKSTSSLIPLLLIMSLTLVENAGL